MIVRRGPRSSTPARLASVYTAGDAPRSDDYISGVTRVLDGGRTCIEQVLDVRVFRADEARLMPSHPNYPQ